MFPGGVVRQGCVACRQSLAPVPCVRMMAAACKCGARNYVVSSPVVTVLYLCFDPYLKCATGRSYKQREQATDVRKLIDKINGPQTRNTECLQLLLI